MPRRRTLMEHAFDFNTATPEITGAYPLVKDNAIVDYLISMVAPATRNELVVELIMRLDGNKPIEAPIVDKVVSALDNLYDRTHVTSVLSPFEEDSFLEYVAWLKGGYTCLDGEVVPFVKPDEDGLVVAAMAIEKMIRARA